MELKEEDLHKMLQTIYEIIRKENNMTRSEIFIHLKLLNQFQIIPRNTHISVIYTCIY